MPCDWLKGPDGAVIHINRGRGGGKRTPCGFCRGGFVSKLCDFPLGDGKTCDAGMCDRCATTKGVQHTPIGHGFTKLNDTLDYCPNHRGATPGREEAPMAQPHVTKLMDIQLGGAAGCAYYDGIRVCRKVCDAGQRLCPRHIIIAAQAEELRKADAERDAADERRKNRSPIGIQRHGK